MTDNETRYHALRRSYLQAERDAQTADPAAQERAWDRLDDLAPELERLHRLVTGETDIDLW